MAERELPVLRTMAPMSLMGVMAIYASQAEAFERIPHQWREFLAKHPALSGSTSLYGASPCSDDRKLHYFTGTSQTILEDTAPCERLVLEGGEYAVMSVPDAAHLRDTWIWLLTEWLPTSGRREKHAPEFEKFTALADDGGPVGPVELWIPLERLGTS